ncbi:MAG: indolepyruvate oxidoreductase subunit beta [Methanotrichaceae archaeon]|nr:indolepyruvate oxidoreductase subunit beta [Methanotrichaceae archaeon]
MSANGNVAKETEGTERTADIGETKSIVIVGVGGQGILLASEILAQAAMLEGYDVKTNEVHGMAQRGGSVMAQIRYGREVHSPLVARNAAHILGALEKIEALRYADYIRPDGLAAVSSQAIMPVTVSSGAAHYPKDAASAEMLAQAFPRLVYIDAAKIAKELGDIRAANVVLLGAISLGLDLPLESWEKAIALCVREKFLEINRRAFAAGRSYS